MSTPKEFHNNQGFINNITPDSKSANLQQRFVEDNILNKPKKLMNNVKVERNIIINTTQEKNPSTVLNKANITERTNKNIKSKL